MTTLGTNIDRRVKINVGGRLFETTVGTLLKSGKSSVLSTMVDQSWQTNGIKDEYFFDRDPDSFERIICWLRTGFVRVVDELDRQILTHECDYYCLQDMKSYIEDSPSMVSLSRVYDQSGRSKMGMPKHR